MGKTLEDMMAELEKKARERMKASQPNSSATIYEDSGATAPENSDATVYEDGNVIVPESDATICEDGDITVPGNETVSEKPMRESSSETYEKGHTLLDTYTVESDPIHGGMGNVWRVHHKGWNVDLAMKRPQAKLFQSEKQKENFIGECEAWINLGLHPNIVSCYYVREIDGVPTIFSEWMENGSLENHIQKGTLYIGTEQEQQERLLDIAIQFARGLHYAHEQGLIHQDVKPDNVLLSKDWDAKVADFGLARARATLTVLEGANTLRDAGATVMAPSGGYTPAYCSMEQMDGKPLTRRTDIYSWAVSVMEMYLGERLWDNGVVAGLSCRDYFGETRVPLPEALKTLLAQCMAAEPEDRPHDFEIMIGELCEIFYEQVARKYPRKQFVSVTQSAESLNNKALSFLDLKKYDEAEKCWKQALTNNSRHVESIYNELIYRWNRAEIDDLEVLKRLRNSDDGSATAMMCQLRVQIARADSGAQRCIEILRQDRNIVKGTAEEAELNELDGISFSICQEPSLFCIAHENVFIADEKDNLGYRLPDNGNDVLIFKDKNGKVTERYKGKGELSDVMFNSSFSQIALICWNETLIYQRKQGLLYTGQEAKEIVQGWQNTLYSNTDNSCIVSYAEGSEAKDALLRRRSGSTFTKNDAYSAHKYGSGDVKYVLRPGGQVLKTLIMRSENDEDAALNLNSSLFLSSDKKHVYKRSIPDLRYRPQMIVSKVISYDESLENDKEYSKLFALAEKYASSMNREDAVRTIDKALNVTGHFDEPEALEKRRALIDYLGNQEFDRVITLNDYHLSDADCWFRLSEEKENAIIKAVLDINSAVIGYDAMEKYSSNRFRVMHRVVATQFPEIYIVTGRGINNFEHPRYGDDMQQSRSWIVVIDTQKKVFLEKLGPDELGLSQCFLGELVVDNEFEPTERIAAALIQDGTHLLVSCSEKKIFTKGTCTLTDFDGPSLDYILPTVSADYYLFVGKNYVALTLVSNEKSEIIWKDYSTFKEFVGFNRQTSTFTVKDQYENLFTREILWNFEKPTLKSRRVSWENLDYFGKRKQRSSYF